MKVTVVVPVYNPGSAIDLCIASLLAQTLKPDKWEAVFVDDGSTDATPARLDALATEHPNISVIHTPNSGWAGGPATSASTPRAGSTCSFSIRTMPSHPKRSRARWRWPIATAQTSWSARRRATSASFPSACSAQNVESCTIENTALIHSLTPHKMFRTAFLREHDLRFPEGRRRLEDQLFVVQAYFRAKVISILADHVCYRYLRRADSQNAGGAAADWDGYYANAREVTDVVFANTAPGELQDTLLLRFVRVEILRRVSDLYFAAQSAASRAQLFPGCSRPRQRHRDARRRREAGPAAGIAPAAVARR